MKCVASTVLLLFLIFWLVGNLPAEEKSNDAAKEENILKLDREEMHKRFEALLKDRTTLGNKNGEALPTQSSGKEEIIDPMMPVAPPSSLALDADTGKEYLAALREYYAYNKAGLQHREQVFKWQLFSSKVIFVVVLLLVFAGIYFAAVQFHVGLRRKHHGETSEGNQITEVAASFKGIKVSSPVLGIVILVISLLFFYLYLAFVYPIKEIF